MLILLLFFHQHISTVWMFRVSWYHLSSQQLLRSESLWFLLMPMYALSIHPQSILWRSFGPLWMPPGHPLDILWTSSGHLLDILWTFSGHSLDILCTFSYIRCTSSVHLMDMLWTSWWLFDALNWYTCIVWTSNLCLSCVSQPYDRTIQIWLLFCYLQNMWTMWEVLCK